MNYIDVIDRYHEYRPAIRELLASMVTGIAETSVFADVAAQRQAIDSVALHYPFVELLFTLDADGIQTNDNVTVALHTIASGKGKDRSQRPYYMLARDSDSVAVTDPYLSSAGGSLCVTAAVKLRRGAETIGYLVLDIDLWRTIQFLMGDTARRRFLPLFKAVYWAIVVGLFSVVGVLLYGAFADVISLFHLPLTALEWQLKPFSAVVYLTLALAIFDLGKTILEEEVLMHKDIFRHSSTRRTITRFIAAILIAVSIEALLLMFKSALGDGAHIMQSVAMMFAAVGLLVGLGLYVNLGAKAEVALLDQKRAAKAH